MAKFHVGDKVRLSAAFKNLKPSVRYDCAESIAHRAAMVDGAGTGTVIRVSPGGWVAVNWENGFASGAMHPRFVKTAR
jgi:hypothetical protein